MQGELDKITRQLEDLRKLIVTSPEKLNAVSDLSYHLVGIFAVLIFIILAFEYQLQIFQLVYYVHVVRICI